MQTSKHYLFVCGCPRSGTTAMWRLLTAAPELVMGVERYGTRIFSPECLSPALFERERFFTPERGDTFYTDLEAFNRYYAAARAGFDAARVVGDKIPKLYDRFADIARNFPRAKVVFMLRNVVDVAASYKRRAEDAKDGTWRRDHGVTQAIADWRRSLQAYRARPPQLDVLPVCYEDLFAKGVGLERLLEFVGVGEAPIREQFRNLRARADQLESQRDRRLTGEEVMAICTQAPFGLYRELLAEIRGTAAAGAPGAAKRQGAA